ncbi:MAG: helix-turn-helix domain-containing protein [Bryobacteraceae bacterium]
MACDLVANRGHRIGAPGSRQDPGNKQSQCFSRQISMYLAKHVGGWSTPPIGRFYNGRHHTTVLHAIQKIERLRERDESVKALLEVLTFAVNPKLESPPESLEHEWKGVMIEAIAARVIDKLIAMHLELELPKAR